jgi:hypothetical protein
MKVPDMFETVKVPLPDGGSWSIRKRRGYSHIEVYLANGWIEIYEGKEKSVQALKDKTRRGYQSVHDKDDDYDRGNYGRNSPERTVKIVVVDSFGVRWIVSGIDKP